MLIDRVCGCYYLATVEGVPIFLWGNLDDRVCAHMCID